MKHPAVYSMASQRNGTRYLGVTSDLPRRVAEHRMHHRRGFTDTYDVTKLVWFEMHPTMERAIVEQRRGGDGEEASRAHGRRDGLDGDASRGQTATRTDCYRYASRNSLGPEEARTRFPRPGRIVILHALMGAE